jgi:DNA-directed RNA polymerase beta subunit
MSMTIEEIQKLLIKAGTVKQPVRAIPTKSFPDDDDDEFTSVGLNGVLAATEKLLAVNRGLIPTDSRDSLRFKSFHSPPDLIRERIRLDANKTRLSILRRVAKTKSLKAVNPYAFDNYTEGFIINNPLVTPLEEINPMHLVEQARRFTQMGPGGLGSTEVITEEAQSLSPSQFGFYDTIAGPESEKIGIDTRLAWGTKIGSDKNIYSRFYDRRKKKYVWLNPDQVADLTMKLPD